MKKIPVLVLIVGLNRSLSHTQRSIEERLIKPLLTGPFFDVKVQSFFIQPTGNLITNPRTGEKGEIESTLGSWAHPTEFFAMDQLWNATAQHRKFLEGHPDRLQDGRKSETNALLFLEALKRSYVSATARGEPAVTIMARPDIAIEGRLRIRLMTLAAAIGSALTYPMIFLPEWGKYRGLNDRFAVMSAQSASAYCTRVDRIQQLIPEGRPFHSESFLAASVPHYKVWSVIKTPMVRIRIGGIREKDDEALADRLRFRRRLGVCAVRLRRIPRRLLGTKGS